MKSLLVVDASGRGLLLLPLPYKIWGSRSIAESDDILVIEMVLVGDGVEDFGGSGLRLSLAASLSLFPPNITPNSPTPSPTQSF